MKVDFDPSIFSLGPLEVRWYGLMYVVAFIVGGLIAKKLCRMNFMKLDEEKVDSLVTHLIISMFLGARMAYVFIYNWNYFSQNLHEVFFVWQGGLSFHGALAGMLVGGYLFARKHGISWAQTMDTVALSGAQGLFFGRIGNFINGELYGRVTDAPIGMIFANGGPYPRHPSQLYEACAEGLLLMMILWFLLPRVKFYGTLSAVFIVGYGTFRFFIEFFRQPDPQLGYFFAGTLTMGQILCLIMIVVGIAAYFLARKINEPVNLEQKAS
jgi:phosphatidylglycerol:prolipoprotein diacylglycerol transferase